MTQLITNMTQVLNEVVLTPVNTVFGVMILVSFFWFTVGVIAGRRGRY